MLDLLTLVCAIGSGVIAGFFFAFSFCVMNALGKLRPEQGIAAMQSINVVVINPWFFLTFFGTAAACVMAVIASLSNWDEPRALLWLAGSVLYIVGTIMVTMVFNVPRNNALAKVAASSDEAAKLWADYLVTWTIWNHVRMAAALVAAVLFTVAAQRA